MKSIRKPPDGETPSAALEPNLDRAVELVLQLMPIPGRSGEEAEVAAVIRERLLQAGAPPAAILTDSAHLRTPQRGNTGNLIFKLPGTQRPRPMHLFQKRRDIHALRLSDRLDPGQRQALKVESSSRVANNIPGGIGC